jgi:D-apionolactonase
MDELTLFQKWYGRDQPPAPVHRLRAGALEVEFEAGDLRYLRLGTQELVRRIYVAIRDVNWDTIPAVISDLKIDQAEDNFQISYQAYHQNRDLKYRWQAQFVGKSDGTLECSMDGTAESDFRYCRIGFCVLHPIEGIAGQQYSAKTPQGQVKGVLPIKVEPQRMENGFEAPIFPSCSRLFIDLENGLKLETAFEGDLFETEDQRNWTDGSFKTYCTPLSLGYPHQARKGQTFHQRIVVRTIPIQESTHRLEPAGEQIVSLTLGGKTGMKLPRLGFGISEDFPSLTPIQADLFTQVRPDHLKAEVHLVKPDWPLTLDHALGISRYISSPLELVLFLPENPEPALAQLKERLTNANVVRVIVFSESNAALYTTETRLIHLVRSTLAPVLPRASFIGGTNGNFAEFNRQPPDPHGLDGVCFTINPQVHAFDERSLVEALQAQLDTVMTARSATLNLPVSISSVTLKPPFNVVATEEQGPANQQALPSSIDPRQVSLFGAAWTAGSIRSLSHGGAGSITYYEMIGARGLMEAAEGSIFGGLFPSFPGMVYPMYWVFQFLAGAKGSELLDLDSERPLQVHGLALSKDNKIWLVISNYQPVVQAACVRGLPGGQANWLRLNQDTAETAASDQFVFPSMRQPLQNESGVLNIELLPFETIMIDITL